LSSAGTGFSYVGSKNPANVTRKLAFIKFDPIVKRRVLFEERKITHKGSTF
jgi:large subunit ribosomal protein L33